jgi:hypothetical protein
MTTFTVQAQIADDGKLCFDLSTGLPSGRAEVVVIVEPRNTAPAHAGSSLAGRFRVPAEGADDVLDTIRQLRRETTEASWELAE